MNKMNNKADIDEYQKLTERTAKKVNENDPKCNRELNIAILAMGYAGEAGEATDYMKKVLGHGHIFNREVLIKEFGDRSLVYEQTCC